MEVVFSQKLNCFLQKKWKTSVKYLSNVLTNVVIICCCNYQAHLKTVALEIKRKMCDDQSNTESLNWNARNSVNISQVMVISFIVK